MRAISAEICRSDLLGKASPKSASCIGEASPSPAQPPLHDPFLAYE